MLPPLGGLVPGLYEGAGPAQGIGATQAPNVSRGITLTANAAANTVQSTFTTLVAATAYEYGMLHITVARGTVVGWGMIELAIGAAASEKVIFTGLQFLVTAGVVGHPVQIAVPLYVPQGVRLSARISYANANSFTADITVIGQALNPRMPPPFHHCFAIGPTGTGATAARGTEATGSNATQNIFGTQVVLSASTPDDIACFFLSTTRGTTTAGTAIVDRVIELLVGAAAAERLLIPHLIQTLETTGESVHPQIFGPFYVSVPAGSRLSGRVAAGGSTSVTLGTVPFSLICFK